MDEALRILFLAPRLPLPADTGGKIRTLNILKQAARQARVHLVCFSFEKDDAGRSQELKERGIDVTLVPMRGRSVLEKVFHVAVNPAPFSIAKYRSSRMAAVLSTLVHSQRFDLVHIDHLHMTHYIQCFDHIPCVVDEHNVEYKILERCLDVEKFVLKQRLFKAQAGKMKKFEARQIRQCSAYFAVSEDDKNILGELCDNRTPGYVVPNGVDTEYFKPSANSHQLSAQSEQAIVFTGSMDWLPNEDAAAYFCQEILPLIWQKAPDTRFYIVGKSPSGRLTQLAKGEERIILTGRVDDVRPYVQRSSVFVVPLRIGGGTRLKILEAMSMRMPVVSTSIGAEGISYTDGRNIAIADAPQAFADKVLELFEDQRKQKSLGDEGRKLVMEQYDWEIVGREMARVYEEIIKR